MDFAFTDTQQEHYDRVVAFARDELDDDVVARDYAGTFATDLWKRCADFGVLGWAVPCGHGGAGLDLVTVAHLMEALGYGCRDNGLTFGLGAQMWGMQTAVLHFGTEDNTLGDKAVERRRLFTGAYQTPV